MNSRHLRFELFVFISLLYHGIIHCSMGTFCICRISVIFRVKSAQKIKLTDRHLLQRLAPILALYVVYLLAWSLAGPSHVIEMEMPGDLKFDECSFDWWDHAILICKCFFFSGKVWLKAFLRGVGGPQEVGNPRVHSNLSWSPHLSSKRYQIKMRDYMDRRVAFGSGLVSLGRQAEKRKELSFAFPNLLAT